MNRLFLCLLAICMFACDNTLGPPKGMLSERKMVGILVDLQVAESKVKTLRVSSDSLRHIFSIYEVQIFDKHNVTPDEYLRSYEYYLENHRLMSRVHQAVLDTLLRRQQKVEKMPLPETAAKPDTVALTLEKLRKDALRLDSLKRDSIRQDSLKRDSVRLNSRERFKLRRDSIRNNSRKPLPKQDRTKAVLRNKELQ